jgi:hypothetical protein
VVAIGPARYNELYKKFGNLNSLLGWGHARVIENLLARRPDCPRSLSDQFADARVIENALLRHGQKIRIEQRPRAESDIAVAAASILAREAFINWLERKGKELGVKLGRGVSGEIKTTAAGIVEKHGPQMLFANRQSPFPHGARGRAELFSGAAAEARLDALAVHCQRPEGQDSCSAGLQTAALFVETRVLILNPDPVFEDRLLSIFDFADETEMRIVRTMAEVVAILIGESFDGFVIEGEPEFAIEAATVARQHFPSLKILCAPWEKPSAEATRKAQQQHIPLTNGRGLDQALAQRGSSFSRKP